MNMDIAKETASKSIGSVFVVRSLLFLLLLNTVSIRVGTAVDQVLDLVNGIRSVVYPRASDMRYMEWSRDFATEALKLARRCDSAVPKPGVMYIKSSIFIDLHEIISGIVNQGEDAIRAGRCRSNPIHLACRFYRDLMEAGADRIGCSAAFCRTTQEYLNYCVTNAKHSNEPFSGLVYQEGTPCQRCPPSAGYCYRKLCVSNARKTAILTETPSSVITCDAACEFCQVRKVVNNSCLCEGTKVYFPMDDECSDSVSQTCSNCRIAGTPCQNGGREAGGPADSCSCLCNSDYIGKFCQYPKALVVGGVGALFRIYSGGPFPFRLGDKLAEVFKEKMADEINLFCRKSETNYLKCCGSGTLPSRPPFDIVNASSVHVASPVLIFHPPYNAATLVISATTIGNDGLCRSQGIATISPTVIKNVIEEQVVHKSLCCGVRVKEVTFFISDPNNVSML